MKDFRIIFTRFCMSIFLFVVILNVSLVKGNHVKNNINKGEIYTLVNDQIKYSVFIENGKLISDKLEAQPEWLEKFGTNSVSIETNTDFVLDLMWTGWRAPGKENNADNFISLSKNDFQLERTASKELMDGTKELRLYLTSNNKNLNLLITYQLEPAAFYIRRKVAVSDSTANLHFLHQIWPLYCQLQDKVTIIKNGGFGQPIAVQNGEGGVFFGLEYPPSQNKVESECNGKLNICCGHEVGKKIGNYWISSEWVVLGLSPNSYVKLWFNRYLEKIRAVPLRPYLLYNSWYDVRSPASVKRQEYILNEQNILRIIGDLKRELYNKRGIKLDAFVLDDGWDIYKSDWVLRKEEFPNGLKPIADTLNKMGTRLGVWFGPIGGYGFRNWRVDWMKENGYEVVGDQLCLGGKNYYKLFKKRVLDFVRKDHVTHFKWDGIQFSCSEPDHGHPIGIYSRKAIMDSVIHLCKAVRNENPDIFLNITSGTWLSPWWIKFANMIWMQGDDYGYANVPSISRRDRAITYRDFSLYQDYGKNDFWFPISNLMTVGIIKGHLAKLGGETEPLNKFTDNAILCLARGISMWELYVSPDLLTDGEWEAIAKSIRWAKDRFDILKNSEMIGGDPEEEKAYGYAHFSGKQGIIAARNPFIEPQKLNVELTPLHGLDPTADSLVIERVYPTRWISPRLYGTGETLEISLDGYETAIYEIYPLEDASYPLVSGVTFNERKINETQYVLELYNVSAHVQIHNPDKIKFIEHEGRKVSVDELFVATEKPIEPLGEHFIQIKNIKKRSEIDVNFDLHKSVNKATLSVLFRSTDNSLKNTKPEVTFLIDGKKAGLQVEKQEGVWAWYQIDIEPGNHHVKILAEVQNKNDKWVGSASVWLLCSQKMKGKSISFDLVEGVKERPMPPRPFPANELKRNIKLGEVSVQLQEK